MIQLTASALRQIFPKAPTTVIEAFVAKQSVLTKAGVNHTRTRLAYFFANIEHECGGFGLSGLTENTNYSPERAAEVFPTRAGRSGAEVAARFGRPMNKRKFFNVVYGTRMGNRPGTDDGWNFIGRGGPQWTGRDGYEECRKRTGIPVVDHPEMIARLELQPEVCVAFWDWKKLNAKADLGDFRGARKLWNGGTNGIADVEAKLAGNDPILKTLKTVDEIKPVVKDLPGKPPTKAPPQEAIDATTENERKVRAGGVAAGGTGAAGEATKAGTEVPATPLLSPFVTYTLIGVGVAIFIVAAVLIARKKAAVIANWF
jgi:predicted chitinase